MDFRNTSFTILYLVITITNNERVSQRQLSHNHALFQQWGSCFSKAVRCDNNGIIIIQYHYGVCLERRAKSKCQSSKLFLLDIYTHSKNVSHIEIYWSITMTSFLLKTDLDKSCDFLKHQVPLHLIFSIKAVSVIFNFIGQFLILMYHKENGYGRKKKAMRCHIPERNWHS